MDEVITEFLPDYAEIVQSLMTFCADVFAGGVLACIIAWSIGYAVHGVYRWLSISADVEERR